MNWTTIPQRACEDAVMALEHWLDEHLNKVGSLVRSLIVDGCPHHNDPTPGAANLGDLLDNTAIQNRDCETGEHPASNERQVALRLAQFSKLFAAAIADLLHVMQVDVLLRNFGDRLPSSLHWLEMLPDLQWRPTRHTIRPELPEGCIIQMVATANLAEG